MHIQIQDPWGQNHQITSRNPETIGRWIIEVYAELASKDIDQHRYPPRVMVYPSWNPETREADWTCDSRILAPGFEAINPRQFYERLGKQLDD